MDVEASTTMRPKLIRIGDTCYRRFDCAADGIIQDLTPMIKINNHGQRSNIHKNAYDNRKYRIDDLEESDFNEQPILNVSMEDDSTEILSVDNEDITTDNKGNFSLKMHVSNTFFRFIIGKRGQTKMNIESETRTHFKIPREGDNQNNFIHIIGREKSAIALAKKRIEQLVKTSRLKQNITHFVSIPIGLDQNVRERYEQFKSYILSDVKCSTSKGIDESVFQNGMRFHITLRALYLGDLIEHKQVAKICETLKSTTLLREQKNPIKLHVKGLDIMNDDPMEAKILYAKVEEVSSDSSFKKIVNHIFDCFEPLAKDSNRFDDNADLKVKIHATILNSRYRNKGQFEASNNHLKQSANSKMDVTNILQKYGDYDFGTVTFNQLHICGVGQRDQDEYYLTIGKIDF